MWKKLIHESDITALPIGVRVRRLGRQDCDGVVISSTVWWRKKDGDLLLPGRLVWVESAETYLLLFHATRDPWEVYQDEQGS